jgi:hypothetical protein
MITFLPKLFNLASLAKAICLFVVSFTTILKVKLSAGFFLI